MSSFPSVRILACPAISLHCYGTTAQLYSLMFVYFYLYIANTFLVFFAPFTSLHLLSSLHLKCQTLYVNTFITILHGLLFLHLYNLPCVIFLMVSWKLLGLFSLTSSTNKRIVLCSLCFPKTLL